MRKLQSEEKRMCGVLGRIRRMVWADKGFGRGIERVNENDSQCEIQTKAVSRANGHEWTKNEANGDVRHEPFIIHVQRPNCLLLYFLFFPLFQHIMQRCAMYVSQWARPSHFAHPRKWWNGFQVIFFILDGPRVG